MTDFRCSLAARLRGDALAGTATHVRAFLLVEDPGPWGVKAWRDARLPDGLGAEILRRSAAARVRPLLIRREERRPLTVRRVFAAYVGRGHTAVETTTITDPRELLDLDLARLADGRPLGLSSWTEPIFAVCTHGKHDTCCAERGRPVVTALKAVEPQATWGVSHMGGDRFAANMLVLGAGLYYGGLDAAAAVAVAAAHRAGHLDLDHLRGHTGHAMPVQAAEIALRRHLGLTAIDAVRFLRRAAEGDTVRATFATGTSATDRRGDGVAPWQVVVRWQVVARPRHTEPARLTCTKVTAEPSVSWVCDPPERLADSPGPR